MVHIDSAKQERADAFQWQKSAAAKQVQSRTFIVVVIVRVVRTGRRRSSAVPLLVLVLVAKACGIKVFGNFLDKLQLADLWGRTVCEAVRNNGGPSRSVARRRPLGTAGGGGEEGAAARTHLRALGQRFVAVGLVAAAAVATLLLPHVVLKPGARIAWETTGGEKGAESGG